MSKNTWCLILNPFAGRGLTSREWPVIQNLLEEAGIPFQMIQTEASGHAISIVQEKIQKGFRQFMAIGGDGTLHECVNGIFKQNEVPPHEIMLGIIPIGTGNDWIRTKSYPKSIAKIVQAMLMHKSEMIDIGVCHFDESDNGKKRYFINVLGLAYDAFVVKYVQEHPPKYLGKLVYLWYALACLWRYPAVSALICTEEICIENAFITIHIGIGKYAGGGMKVLPHAGKNEGKLAVMAAENMPKWKILLNMWRFYIGDIRELKQVRSFMAESVEVKPENGNILVEADGELIGMAPVKVSIIPSAIQTLSVS